MRTMNEVLADPDVTREELLAVAAAARHVITSMKNDVEAEKATE